MTTVDTGTTELLCELADGVATVTLNKPDKRNALGDVLTPALREILLVLEEDARCGAVVITGAGRAFCAGGDVSGMGGGPAGPSAGAAPRRAPPSAEDRMRTLVRKQEALTLPNWPSPPSPRCPDRRPARAFPSPWHATCA